MTTSAYALVDDLIKKGMSLKSLQAMTDIPMRTFMDLLDGTTKNLEYTNFKKILYFYCKFTNLK